MGEHNSDENLSASQERAKPSRLKRKRRAYSVQQTLAALESIGVLLAPEQQEALTEILPVEDVNSVDKMVIAGAVVVCLVMFYSLLRPGMSALDTELVTILIAIATFIASWRITKIYSERQMTMSLRDQSVQIARGVELIVQQLNRDFDWISDRTARVDITDLERTLLSEQVKERFSVLSDLAEHSYKSIAATIGDASRQYEEAMRTVAAIREVNAVRQAILQRQMETASSRGRSKLAREWVQNAVRTEQQIATLERRAPLPLRTVIPRRTARAMCPYPDCGHSNRKAVRIGDHIGATAPTLCDECGRPYNLHVLAGGEIKTGIPSGAPSQRAHVPAGGEIKTGTPKSVPPRRGVEYDVWMPPEALSKVLHEIVAIHNRLAPDERTPYQLKIRTLESPVALTIARNRIQQLFWYLYTSRTFQFGNSPGTHRIYQNNLTFDDLLRGCARAYAARLLKNHADLSDIASLAGVFFGDEVAEGPAVLQDALDELTDKRLVDRVSSFH